MMTIKEFARNRWGTLGVVLGLALFWFLVFRPFAQRAESLDKPLDKVWRELVDFSLQSSGVSDLDLNQIEKNQELLRASLAATEEVRREISARVDLEPEMRAKMNEPFFLIDFQNERQKRTEQLTALAATRKVALDAPALAGFPQYKAETRDPSVLWAQLSLVDHILTVAINCEVGHVNNLTLLPTQPVPGATGGERTWQEIPLRIELIAPMAAAEKFLFAMPLRADEMKAAGLPESSPGKPALFIKGLLLRKQTPEKPDEVSLDVTISGFVRGPKGQPSRMQEKGALP